MERAGLAADAVRRRRSRLGAGRGVGRLLSSAPPTAFGRALLVGALLAACGVVGLLAGPHFAAAIEALLDLRAMAREQAAMDLRMLAILILYACLIAIPFVSGAELGLLLLMLFGAPLAGPVYAATVAGLLLAFAVGRLAPRARLRRLPGRLSLGGVTDAADRIAAVPAGSRPEGAKAASGWVGRLLRWRCCALVLMINTPGNTLPGGGGGISMAAGMSGLFGFRDFLASVLIGVALVPALVLLASLWR